VLIVGAGPVGLSLAVGDDAGLRAVLGAALA
jgi:2-polyprenyl-6-methoxyphenol hydroxylase-like FAD-dependent oxidoreductase